MVRWSFIGGPSRRLRVDCERSTRLKMRLSVRAGVAQARRIPIRHREIIGDGSGWHIYCEGVGKLSLISIKGNNV